MSDPGMSDDAPQAKKASLAHKLYHGETTIDFVGRRNIWFIVSAVVIAGY